MANTPSPSELDALKEVFISHPKTKWVSHSIQNPRKKWRNEVGENEELREGQYHNWDLVMKTRELVLDAIIVILDLEIIDTRASFSGPRKIDNIKDLRYTLAVMHGENPKQKRKESHQEAA